MHTHSQTHTHPHYKQLARLTGETKKGNVQEINVGEGKLQTKSDFNHTQPTHIHIHTRPSSTLTHIYAYIYRERYMYIHIYMQIYIPSIM